MTAFLCLMIKFKEKKAWEEQGTLNFGHKYSGN